GCYDRHYESYQKPNYQNAAWKHVEIKQKIDTTGKPVFYTTEQIRAMEYPPEEYIKTGVTVIDRKMRGLCKGAVTCITGLRGGGKSSFISQLAIEAANQDYRVALFSGELSAKNTYEWLVLQSAGEGIVEPTNYENFWRVSELTEEKI